MIKSKLTIISLVFSCMFSGQLLAEEEECVDAGVLSGSMITDIPWNAMYPIKLAGIQVSGDGGGAPSGAVTSPLCTCDDDSGVPVPGFTQSMFEPARLIEVVRKPDCFLSLGSKIEMTNGRKMGSIGKNEQGEGQGAQTGFWHYHYFSYPLLLMLEMYAPNRCGDGYMSMDLLYFSELDPTHSDPELSFFANPEATIFANPISLAACMTDAVTAAVTEPIDSLFWCAGAWGGLYPFSGYVKGHSSVVTKTSLIATRSVGVLHRRLLARKTMGESALCSANIFPSIIKSQYKMSMMYPVVESLGAHRIGQTDMTWGAWRNIPSREDAIYMLWRWNDCCSTYF